MGWRGRPLPTFPATSTIPTNQNHIDMKQNNCRRPNGTTRRLCRPEDKLDIILSDLNRIHTRLNWLQSQINSRNELEMDVAINRLKLAADTLKETADKELKAVKERYGTSSI